MQQKPADLNDSEEGKSRRLSYLTKLRYFNKISKPTEKFTVYFFSLLLILSLIGGSIEYYLSVTKTVPAPGGTYSEGLSIESEGVPTTVNPILAETRPTDALLASLVYSSLFQYDGEGQLVGDLVDKYELQDEGKKYVLHLKKNVFWHDGQRLTAKDVTFTLKLLQDPLYNPINAVEWNDEKIKVESPDEETVVINLSEPYAPFLNKLTFGILPEHLWRDVDSKKFASVDLNLQPVGSGPFVFGSLNRNKDGDIVSYKLLANQKYYGQRPFLEKIILKFYPDLDSVVQAYKQKEINGFASSNYKKIDELRQDKTSNIYKMTVPQYFAVFLNQTKSVPLADKNVRRALQYATDREAIVKNVFGDYAEKVYSPLLKPFIKEDFSFPEELTKYSPDKAKELLDKAGWKSEKDSPWRKKDGQELKIKLITTDTENLLATAELLKKQWETIGVGVDIVTGDNKLDIKQKYLNSRDYEALILGLEYSGNDPNLFFFWHSSGKKVPGLNFAMYDNEEVDKLLEESKLAQDRHSENLKYIEVAKHLLEDSPAIFLYSPKYVYVVTRKIKGVELEAIVKTTDRLKEATRWYIKTKRVKK